MLTEEFEIQFNNKIDLEQTLESGQTFLWNKKDGQMFEETTDNIYKTCRNINGDIVALELEDSGEKSVLVRSNNSKGKDIVEKTLGEYSLNEIQDEIVELDSNDGIMQDAIFKYPGLRIVNEPLFPTLISFICSTQMRVERIHSMINNIRNKYGEQLNSTDFYTFPTPEQLGSATEEELKDLKLGYRAGYVKDTVDMYDKNFCLSDNTADAREEIKRFKGVGTKVADCVLLYGAGHWDVVPVDTWIESAVDNYYPSLHSDSNEEIARNFEDHFGQYAGFAQAYLFHYARMNN